ncbi:hypothetical protein ACFLSU_07995 [Bacteroidota bacterium]
MYASVHGAKGSIVITTLFVVAQTFSLDFHTLILALVFGSVFSFLLHGPMDLLGEKNYGNNLKAFLWEGPLALFTFSTFFWHDNWQIFVFGWLAGNGMDIIDKKLYVYYVLKTLKDYCFSNKSPRFDKVIKWFEPIRLFACHQRKPKYNLTLKQTQLSAVLSYLIVISLTFLL